MLKSAPRLLVAVQDAQVWRMLSRIAGASHEVVRASLGAGVEESLDSPVSIAVVEPLVGRTSGLKVLDRIRESHPQAMRVVVSNFSEISLLIEGVHSGLVQRILGLPIAETEVRALLLGERSGGPVAAPLPPFTARPFVAAAR